jgi:hypothetical protein
MGSATRRRWHRDVFADAKDGFISLHFFRDTVTQSLSDRLAFHVADKFSSRVIHE